MDVEGIFEGLEAASKKLYVEKKFKEVEEMLTTFLKETEGQDEGHRQIRARAYNDRGHARYMRVEFDAAVEDYDLAVALSDGKLAVCFYNRGTVRYRLGQHQEALPDLTRACQMEPDSADFKEALEACQSQLQS